MKKYRELMTEADALQLKAVEQAVKGNLERAAALYHMSADMKEKAGQQLVSAQ